MKNKIVKEMKSYGTQTISDNSLLDIGKGIVLYPLEGNLIIFDCNEYKEIKKIFLSHSLIKIVKKIPSSNNYIICFENGLITLLNKDFQVMTYYRPNEINNVYSLDISIQIKDEEKNVKSDIFYYYISISHYSITDKEDFNKIVYSKNAISLLKIEINKNVINFTKIFTKQSLNNFSLFYYNKNKNNLELFSFHWDEKKKINILCIFNISEYERQKYNIKVNFQKKSIDNMITEIKGYKRFFAEGEDTFSEKIIILCKKRKIYIFNLDTLNIEDLILFEGIGELGEFCISGESILISNSEKQLIEINISEKIFPKYIPLDKSEHNLSDIILIDDFIHSINWGIIKLKLEEQNYKIFLVNAYGIKIYKKINNKWIENYFSSNILKISGCGTCLLEENIYAYGDLSGSVILFNSNNQTLKKVSLKKEMVRSLCSDVDKKSIYIGTISGTIYKYNYCREILEIINKKEKEKNNSEEAITCLRYESPYLYSSNTSGIIQIYETEKLIQIFSFVSHEPQKNNIDLEFGSLSIKSEIWSMIVHKINKEEFFVISGSEDQKIKIWKIIIYLKENKVKYNKLVKEIKKHKYAVTCLDWSKIKWDKCDKEVLLSCSDDKTINLFDADKEKFNNILNVDFKESIYGFLTLTYCSFNHLQNLNSSLIAIGTQAGYLIIYDFIRKEILFLDKIHYGGIEGLVFINDAISTCGNDNIFNIILLNN